MTDRTLPVSLLGFSYGEDDPRLAQAAAADDGVAAAVADDDAAAAAERWPEGEKRRYGIQFRQPLTREQYQTLRENYGLDPEMYVPKYTYVQLVDRPQLERLRLLPIVNGVFPFEAKYKISPGIGELSFRTPSRRELSKKNELLLWAVVFPKEEKLNELAEALQGLGAKETRLLNDRDVKGSARIEFRLDRAGAGEAVQAIAELDAVSWVEEVPEARPSSGTHGDLMQTGMVDGTPFTDFELRGLGEVIGVFDLGRFQEDHCWFKDDTNPVGPAHRKILSIRATATPVLLDPHAAFVTGILVGEDLSNTDPDAIRGIVLDAKVTYCNTEDFSGGPAGTTLGNYLSQTFIGENARVYNNSWHAKTVKQYTQKAVDVDEFSWNNEKCLVVASSGNFNENWGAPGVAKNALTVSAAYVDAGTSCWGDGVTADLLDGRRKPDILAPGCSMQSAKWGSSCAPVTGLSLAKGPLPPKPGCVTGTEDVRCFTSFATPVATAAAVIARQYFRDGWYPNGTPGGNAREPSGALLKALLINSTEQTSNTAEYPTKNEGWGVIQLNRVLYLAGRTPGGRKLRVEDIPNSAGIFPGDPQDFTVQVESSDVPLKIVLVWTDPPASADPLDPVINDLDLRVTSPSDETYIGNCFALGESKIKSAEPDDRPRDDRNNVEVVLVKHPEIGPWTITVDPVYVDEYKSPHGQGFALAVTGALP